MNLRRVLRQPENAAGALYLADFLNRGRSGALNSVEKAVYAGLQKRDLIPDAKAIAALTNVGKRTLALLADAPETRPILERLGLIPTSPAMAAFLIKPVRIGVLRQDQRLLPLFNGNGLPPPDMAFKGGQPSEGDLEGVLDRGKDWAKALKEARKLLKEGRQSAENLTNDGEEESESQPNGGPVEIPEDIPSQFLARSLSEPGYRVAIDQIICHEEEETVTNDNLVFAFQASVVQIDGSVRSFHGASSQEYE